MTETAPKKNYQRYDTKNEPSTLSHPHTPHTCSTTHTQTQIRLKETRPTTTTRLTMKFYSSATRRKPHNHSFGVKWQKRH